MNLREHMEILAQEPSLFAFCAHVEESVVRRALDGLPITKLDAKKIQQYVGQRFGHPHNAPEDYPIDNLQAV